jgi:hypothetical protein
MPFGKSTRHLGLQCSRQCPQHAYIFQGAATFSGADGEKNGQTGKRLILNSKVVWDIYKTEVSKADQAW